MLRYLNTFILLGLALIAISLAGFATQGRFLKEPGEPSQEQQVPPAVLYLIGGGLMLLNGFISIRTAPPPARKKEDAADPENGPEEGPDFRVEKAQF